MQTKKSQESQRLINSVKEFFNQTKELSSRREEIEQGLSEVEQAFVKKLPTSSYLLDIGCATGRLCLALAQRGYTVTGVDVAEKQIQQAQTIAKKEQIDVTFLHYEPPTLPFPDASFAAAFLIRTYCYVPYRAARIAFLEEIARVLTPDGFLFMSQQILDPFTDAYEPTYDENYHQAASGYETLEAGDNFSTGITSYVHYFLEADLKAELEESPFQLIESSAKREILSCVLRKHRTDPKLS